MAKYFYVYNIAGVEDSIVKMFNTDTGAMGEKSVKKDRMDGFIDGIKTSGFVLNKELADADVAEAEAKRVLAEKMTAYQAARDDYHSKSETLKKVKAMVIIVLKLESFATMKCMSCKQVLRKEKAQRNLHAVCLSQNLI